MTVATVIPCLNEERTIGALVSAIRKQSDLVIVVDDGSTDRTAAIARNSGASVISHSQNQGKGTALRAGLHEALRLGAEWGLSMDGDGQHCPEDLPAFWECRRQTNALMVVGNRMHDARSMPWVRRHVNRIMSRLLSRQSGVHLPDTQCGYRLIHLPTWGGMSFKAARFEVESEMLLGFLAAGHKVAFTPIQVVGRGWCSHICPVSDTLRWWRWWRGMSKAMGRSKISL